MNYTTYTLIALGGAIGAVSRFLVSTWVYSKAETIFPWGTFAVNISGCFLVGLVYILSVELLVISPNMRTFLAVGFLGAYTTYSTFSLEILNLLKAGQIKLALLNSFGTLLAGLLAVWAGFLLARIIVR